MMVGVGFANMCYALRMAGVDLDDIRSFALNVESETVDILHPDSDRIDATIDLLDGGDYRYFIHEDLLVFIDQE